MKTKNFDAMEMKRRGQETLLARQRKEGEEPLGFAGAQAGQGYVVEVRLEGAGGGESRE